MKDILAQDQNSLISLFVTILNHLISAWEEVANEKEYAGYFFIDWSQTSTRLKEIKIC